MTIQWNVDFTGEPLIVGVFAVILTWMALDYSDVENQREARDKCEQQLEAGDGETQ